MTHQYIINLKEKAIRYGEKGISFSFRETEEKVENAWIDESVIIKKSLFGREKASQENFLYYTIAGDLYKLPFINTGGVITYFFDKEIQLKNAQMRLN